MQFFLCFRTNTRRRNFKPKTQNRKIREENRKVQEEAYKAWKVQDAELESQINADKEKLKALEVLTGEKSSFLEFVPKAQAYENI